MASNLFAGLIFGTIGFAAFIYGKKQGEWKPLTIGLLLMAFPYFLTNNAALWTVGILLCLALFLFR